MLKKYLIPHSLIHFNGYKKHQPTKSDVLKAIELWEIIAENLSGKLTVFIKDFSIQAKRVKKNLIASEPQTLFF
jgi:hypothetical protein